MPDKSTQPRLDITKVSPHLYKAMAGLQNYVEASGLERKLLDLVKIRASPVSDVPTASSCILTPRASVVKPTERMHLLMPGTRRRLTAHASAPPLPGLKRLQKSATITCRMMLRGAPTFF